jgi:hypothetical protein
VIYDSVSADCSVHAVGEADIGSKEGYIQFSGAIEYFFGGESSVTLNGTLACTGSTTSYTSSDPQKWWPSVMGTFKVHDDGSLSDTVTHGELGLKFVDMTWSLLPQN